MLIFMPTVHGIQKLTVCVHVSFTLFSIQSKKTGPNRRQLLLDSRVDPANYGTVVELASFTAGGQDVVCFATTRGKLCGLDLRSNQMVWELTNEAKYGMFYK